MAEKKLMVVIGAKASEFNRAMADVKKQTKDISKTFRDVGRDMQAVGGVMTAAVTVPIVAVGAFAAKTGIEFESAFAGVRKTVDATAEELAGLSDGIRGMAKEIPAAATEIAGVAEAAGQLGIKTENILSFTRTMIDLGESTNLSAEEAATALARLANITQMPQTQFDRIGSVIVALGNNLATTEAEIVEMGLRLAGAGKQVGMTEAQILSFAGALSSVGIEAQAGGSAFSKVMVQMQLAAETGGKDLEAFASVAGMSGEQFRKAFQEDAAGAIIAFIQGLGNAEERGMSAIKVLDDMGIKEVRLRDALLRAAGAGDLFSESLAIGTQAWAENTALTTEAEQRYETTASQLEILKNKFTDMGIELYENLGPVLKDTIIPMAERLIECIGKLVEWFTSLSPSVQKFLIIAAGIAAAIGPVLIVVGKIATAIGAIIPIVAKIIAVAKIVGAAVAGVISGPVLLIIGAIAAAIAIGVLLWKNWDKIKEFAIETWGAIKDFLKGAIDSIVTFFSELPGKVWNFLKETYDKLTIWASDTWNKAKEAGQRLLDNFIDFVKQLPGKLWNWLSESIKKMISWQTDLRNKAIEAGKNVLNSFINVVKALPGQLWDILLECARKLLSIGGQLWENAKRVASNLWEGFKSGLGISSPSYIEEALMAIQDTSKATVAAMSKDFRSLASLPMPEMAMNYALQGAGGIQHIDTSRNVHHSGTITVKGINNHGELIGAVDIVLKGLDDYRVQNKIDQVGYRSMGRNLRPQGQGAY